MVRHTVWALKRTDGTVSGSKKVFASESSYSDDLVLALVKTGCWDLREAIMIAVRCGARCMNVLAFEHGLSWGYAADSDDAKRCGTSCLFCREPEE